MSELESEFIPAEAETLYAGLQHGKRTVDSPAHESILAAEQLALFETDRQERIAAFRARYPDRAELIDRVINETEERFKTPNLSSQAKGKHRAAHARQVAALILTQQGFVHREIADFLGYRSGSVANAVLAGGTKVMHHPRSRTLTREVMQAASAPHRTWLEKVPDYSRSRW